MMSGAMLDVVVVVRRAQRGEPAGGCLRRRPATSGLDAAKDRRARALGRATLRHLQDSAGQQRLRLEDPRQVGCSIACSLCASLPVVYRAAESRTTGTFSPSRIPYRIVPQNNIVAGTMRPDP